MNLYILKNIWIRDRETIHCTCCVHVSPVHMLKESLPGVRSSYLPQECVHTQGLITVVKLGSSAQHEPK